MALHKPEDILKITIQTGMKKVNYPRLTTCILGFQAGAFIALGYLLYIRVTAPMSISLAGFSNFLGAAVFPLGLILTLLAGGELLTGNMMVVPLARLANKITLKDVLLNWTFVTISNFLGAIFVAYFFGHIIGLTETGVYLVSTIQITNSKLNDTFLQAFISGIGCNWLVALAVWLSYGCEDMIGKIAGIWFPTMAFVAIGFQHVVANMFVIPATIFAGYATWGQYISNFVPVFLGNATGGLFVATAYWFAYKKNELSIVKTSKEENTTMKESWTAMN